MAILHHRRTEDSNEAVLEDLDEALRRMAEWGLTVPEKSRFRRYRERLAGLMASPLGMAPVSEIQQHQFDYREIDEMIAIVGSFKSRPAQQALARLDIMISGQEGPDAEPSSAGRDAQWELYLRALLRRVGVPAFLGNPDITARILGRDVPIEAKRPKSEERLDDRLRKGVSQLRTAGVAGVVAFSLDRAIRQGRGLLSGPTPAAVEVEVMRLVREMVNRNLRQITARVAGRPVLGLVFQARIPTWCEQPGQYRLVTHGHLELVGAGKAERPVLDVIMDALASG